jgi:hypothetical protein
MIADARERIRRFGKEKGGGSSARPRHRFGAFPMRRVPALYPRL